MEIRKDIITRFGIIYFLIAIIGIVIVAKILIIQNVDTEHWQQIAKDLKSNTEEIWAKRGNICADNGSILSTSVPYYEIRMDLKAPRVKEVFDSDASELASEVSTLLGVSRYTLLSRLKTGYKKGNRWFLLCPDKLNFTELQALKRLKSMANSKFGSGLIVVGENKRILPHGELASRTIGTLNKGIFGGIHGNIGYTGIEGLEENYLAGENGLALKRNYSGRWIGLPLIEPEDGKDVITTINVNLQDYAQTALMTQMVKSQAEWGTAVVMEVKTGSVKAIANLGRTESGDYAEIYNYAIGHAGCSEPGSTFKLMSLMVALEHGYVDTSEVYNTGDGSWQYKKQKMFDSDYHHGGHGRISVKRIFELSSNIGVAQVITKYYEGKEEEFIDRIYNFGLNKPLGLGFMGEGVPYIKYPTDRNWWGPSLAWISHGYEIKLTPMQTLTFYNAVANNGRMVKPKFVEEVRDNGSLVRDYKTEIINPSICSRKTLQIAQSLLRGVCTEGTAKNLQNPYYTIAGKTGTAVIANENKGYTVGGKKNYQASFVGYFPAEDPKYTCIVVIVGPKGLSYYGGTVAGPVFREIADKVYATFLDPKEDTTNMSDPEIPTIKSGMADEILLSAKELNIPVQTINNKAEVLEIKDVDKKIIATGVLEDKDLVPDVLGMGVSDAVYILEKAGMIVKINGFGKVINQSLKAGEKFSDGQTIYIELG